MDRVLVLRVQQEPTGVPDSRAEARTLLNLRVVPTTLAELDDRSVIRVLALRVVYVPRDATGSDLSDHLLLGVAPQPCR